MSLSTREGLSPIEVLELDMQLDEEMPCEHYGHDDDPMFHGGPGEWYLQFKCPNCGADGDVMLICDEFKKSCLEWGIVCGECDMVLTPGEGFLFVERK